MAIHRPHKEYIVTSNADVYGTWIGLPLWHLSLLVSFSSWLKAFLEFLWCPMKVINPKAIRRANKNAYRKNGPKKRYCLCRPFIFPPVIQHGTRISSKKMVVFNRQDHGTKYGIFQHAQCEQPSPYAEIGMLNSQGLWHWVHLTWSSIMAILYSSWWNPKQYPLWIGVLIPYVQTYSEWMIVHHIPLITLSTIIWIYP